MDIITLQANDFKSPEVYTTSCCQITPEIAQQMLQKNINNIPPNINKLRIYAAAMSKGKWLLNGDCIRFDKEGLLLDGQNRLMACVKADVSFETAIVTGLDKSVFNTIDQGRVRSKSNLIARLYNEDITSQESGALATAIPRIMYHDEGYSFATIGGGSAKRFLTPSVDAIDNWIKENPSIIDDCKYVFDKIGKKGVMTKAECLFFLHIGKRFDKEYGLKFFQKLFLGNDLEEGETIHLLRDLLIEVKSGQTKLTAAILHNSIMKVWNSVSQRGLRAISKPRYIRWRSIDEIPFMKEPKLICIEQMLAE